MNVLTLWQPWASLFAYGIKKIETRPKAVNYTGVYLIHAAKRMDRVQKETCEKAPFKKALKLIGINHWSELPLGAIIGAYNHIECCEIEMLTLSVPVVFPQTMAGYEALNLPMEMNGKTIASPELDFGDYRHGRFAWIGQYHRILINPLPYANGQGYYQKFKGDESKLEFIMKVIDYLPLK